MPIANGARFTSAFGKRDIDNGPRDHWGIDFGGYKPGDSEFVMAAADGVVWFIKKVDLRSGPESIGIKHPDGTLTLYVHTRNIKVKVGQQVRRGEVIAESWHTGIPLSNGIHLHFEWWKDYRDHRSVFDPRAKLAEYGWVLKWDSTAKAYRMFDEWEGRATKTPPPGPSLNADRTIVVHAAPPVPAVPEAVTEKEVPMLTPDQNTKLNTIHTSASTAVITDRTPEDKVTVAGALSRLLTLARKTETDEAVQEILKIVTLLRAEQLTQAEILSSIGRKQLDTDRKLQEDVISAVISWGMGLRSDLERIDERLSRVLNPENFPEEPTDA